MNSIGKVVAMCVVISGAANSVGAAPDTVLPHQTIHRAGSLGSFPGPSKYFTGEVRVDLHYPSPGADTASGATVHFSQGARSAWHTHPGGQHIVVLSGVGWTQCRGGPIEEIRAGDTVWCPPGVEHWHGASPLQAMSHLVVTGSKGDENVVWGELVTDAEYFSEQEILSERHRFLASIAASTAAGRMPELRGALARGLDAGLTVNEAREVLIQMYAYAGFPRSLNGIHTLMAVLEERRSEGKQDRVGPEAGVFPGEPDLDTRGAWVRAGLAGVEEIGEPQGFQVFAPVLDTYLKEHLFGDLFGRDVLSFLDREVATVGALAALPGTAPQLGFHLGAVRNAGLTDIQLGKLIDHLGPEIGPEQEKVAIETLARFRGSEE